MIISKQLANPNDPNILAIIKKHIDNIDGQLSTGLNSVLINAESNADGEDDLNTVEIKKDDVKGLIEKHVEQASRLLNAILQEQNIDINDVATANYCSFSFKKLVGEMLQKYFPDTNSDLFQGYTEFSVSNGIGRVVRLLYHISAAFEIMI